MELEVKRKKLFLGLIYGLAGGLAFAVFAWGVDAWLLARANVAFYGVKFIPGLLICIPAGGITGWLTARFNSHRTALLLWGLLTLLYSWLVVWLPLEGTPYLIKALDPDLGRWIEYSTVGAVLQFRAVSFIIISFAAIICGLLELNLIGQALLSPYGSSSATMLLVCLILFGAVGSASDHMINTNFREPLQVVDDLIQFAADNEGQEVPRAIARSKHLSAVNQIEGLLQSSRQLTLLAFDPNLGLMDILVDFEGSLVKCTTIYAQPTDCILLVETP